MDTPKPLTRKEEIEEREYLDSVLGGGDGTDHSRARLLATLDAERARAFLTRTRALNSECETKLHEYMHSDQPGHWAVPRAVLHRYWKRIVANLAGIVTSALEPVQSIDYLDGGATDITDD